MMHKTMKISTRKYAMMHLNYYNCIYERHEVYTCMYVYTEIWLNDFSEIIGIVPCYTPLKKEQRQDMCVQYTAVSIDTWV